MDLASWEWTCACCGQRRRGIPALAFEGPVAWSVADRDPDVTLVHKSSDFCELEIHGARFIYIRCVLPVPLIFVPGESFEFGVWSTLSADNARRYRETFDDPCQSRLGTMFGYLGNVLPGYPSTENLHLDVIPRDHRLRPVVRVRDHDAAHPLCRDQREGWDAAMLAAMLSRIMPCEGSA